MFRFLFLCSMMVSSTVFAQDGQKCMATDPTGTPLNVRAEPSGKILRTIHNGKLVTIEAFENDYKGQPWVLISDRKTKKTIGWVFREFVSCF